MSGVALALLSLGLPSRAFGQPVDVPYVPTPPAVVTAMLTIARVGPSDVVYDLGSGDGRIVIAAAGQFGARGVGIERNPLLIGEARAAAERAGVSARVRFVEQDFFTADLREATVVTLYLLPAVNLKIREKLRTELRPGTRVVSHYYAMGDWLPDFETEVAGRKIFYWVIPGGGLLEQVPGPSTGPTREGAHPSRFLRVDRVLTGTKRNPPPGSIWRTACLQPRSRAEREGSR